MEILKLMIPIGWAIVSASVGLVLFRYSTAMVKTKAARFTGAAAIAAASFYGLYRATNSMIERPPANIVRANQLLEDQQREIHTALGRCVDEGKNEEECMHSLQAVQTYALEIGEALALHRR